MNDAWREVVDRVAARHRLPSTTDVDAIAADLTRLSETYNRGVAPAEQRSRLAARLHFSPVRDLQKSAAAVAGLVRGRLLDAAPLRVLDLGAGLGAGTIGLLLATSRPVVATWVDLDEPAMRLGAEVAAEAQGAGLLPASTITIERRSVDDVPAGEYDVVIASQVIRELDLGLADDARLDKVAARVATWHARVAPHGALVLIEPALRDATRFLHRLRDRLIATGATIFAPCLHAAPCPALTVEGDWCHEDLPIDLPTWLQPIARAAGLRWEGLTFSYLVVRKDGKTQLDAAPRARLRVVSGPLPSKGKCERYLCGTFADGVATRRRIALLKRDRSDDNVAFETCDRGTNLVLAPAPASTDTRLLPGTRLE